MPAAAALLGLVLAAAASVRPVQPARLCVIDQPVNWIMITDPARTVAAHCGRLTAAERDSAMHVDSMHLRRGVYHLFSLPNEGPVRVEWAGTATGTQIFVSAWNGKAFEIADLRAQPGARVTHALEVRRPASEPMIYVLVNSTNGSIATDGFRVHPLGEDVARAEVPRAPPSQTARVSPTLGPLYLAWCRSDSKAVLIASSSAQGITTAPYYDAELERLATELGPATWYPAPAEGDWRVLGERFGTPAVTNEDGLWLLELGACDTPGAIYSTAPTTEFESATAYGEQAMRSMRQTARGVAGRRLGAIDAAPAPDRHVSLRLCGREKERCFGWMLLDANRRPKRVTAPSERRSWLSLTEPQTQVELARWLKPRAGTSYWVGLIPWDASESECDGQTCGSLSQEGLWLVWMRGAKAVTVRVVVKELKA